MCGLWVIYCDCIWTILQIRCPSTGCHCRRGVTPHVVPSRAPPSPPALPVALGKAPGHREAGGTCDSMYKSQITLLQQHLDQPRRGEGCHHGSYFKKKQNIQILKPMLKRKRYNSHLTKRKNSDDRFKDDHTKASGRATQRAQAIRVICLHTRMHRLLLIQLQVTLHLHKKNAANISSRNIP